MVEGYGQKTTIPARRVLHFASLCLFQMPSVVTTRICELKFYAVTLLDINTAPPRNIAVSKQTATQLISHYLLGHYQYNITVNVNMARD